MIRAWPKNVNIGGRIRTFAISSKESPLWEVSEGYKLPGKTNAARAPATHLGRGKIAGLAHGGVVGQEGNTVVLATVVSDRSGVSSDGGEDGTPFSVEYREKPAASGRIPRTPNRRELANNEAEILTGRAIDRCLRPLFPPLYGNTAVPSQGHTACSGVQFIRLTA